MKNHKSHLAWLKSYTEMSILTLRELKLWKLQKSPHMTRKLQENVKTHLTWVKTEKSQKSQKLHKNVDCKRYLIDGMGVAAWLFGEFSMWGERYYFCVEGSMQGGHEMRIATWGENGHVRWLLHGGGTTQHKGTQSGWCKVTLVWWRGQFDMGACKVDMRWAFATQGTFVWWRGQVDKAF